MSSQVISARVPEDERLLARAAAVRRGEPLSVFIAAAVRQAALSTFADRGEQKPVNGAERLEAGVSV